MLQQESPNVFVRGPHKLFNNTSTAGHLKWCDFFWTRCITKLTIFL